MYVRTYVALLLLLWLHHLLLYTRCWHHAEGEERAEEKGQNPFSFEGGGGEEGGAGGSIGRISERSMFQHLQLCSSCVRNKQPASLKKYVHFCTSRSMCMRHVQQAWFSCAPYVCV